MIYRPPTPQPNNVGAYRFTYPATPDNTSPTYTPWPTRVLAALIDGAAVLVVAVATIATQHHYIAVGPRRTRCAAHAVNAPTPYACHSSLPISGPPIYLIAGIAVLAYVVWNYGYRQGTTGSSLGKSVVGFKVINEHTGQPLGIVASTVRQAAHLLDALAGCAGYLLPLWDVRRRTLADKNHVHCLHAHPPLALRLQLCAENPPDGRTESCAVTACFTCTGFTRDVARTATLGHFV